MPRAPHADLLKSWCLGQQHARRRRGVRAALLLGIVELKFAVQITTSLFRTPPRQGGGDGEGSGGDEPSELPERCWARRAGAAGSSQSARSGPARLTQRPPTERALAERAGQRAEQWDATLRAAVAAAQRAALERDDAHCACHGRDTWAAWLYLGVEACVKPCTKGL